MPGAAVRWIAFNRTGRDFTNDVWAATRQPVGVRETHKRARVVGLRRDHVFKYRPSNLGDLPIRLDGGDQIIRTASHRDDVDRAQQFRSVAILPILLDSAIERPLKIVVPVGSGWRCGDHHE